jgi:hypothetical protein
VEFLTHNFRLAREILENRDAWGELVQVARSIGADEIVEAHLSYGAGGKRLRAGGQAAINQLFRERLAPLGWIQEPRLFSQTGGDLRKWKMDFIKARIGVEVSFNHFEAVPWTFTRLNIAGESVSVLEEHRIDVGVAFFATDSLKKWAKMDDTVGTFEMAKAWLEMMKPIMPIPILVVGLSADDWATSTAFRGTKKTQRSKMSTAAPGKASPAHSATQLSADPVDQPND